MLKKRWKGILFLVAVFLLLLTLLPLPIPVNKTISGIEFSMEGKETLDDQLIVKGTYYYYLFRDSVFQGKIQIVSRDSKGDLRLLKVALSGDPYIKGRMRNLNYYSASRNQILPLGSIQVRGIFREVMLWYPYREGEEQRFFLSPAVSREEAVKRADALTKGLFGFKE